MVDRIAHKVKPAMKIFMLENPEYPFARFNLKIQHCNLFDEAASIPQNGTIHGRLLY
jgi:hypothetical protein